MSQCPNCHAENTPNTRFCAECGVRLDPPPAAQGQPVVPGPAQNTPARTTGKETVVLRALEPAPAEPLPNETAPPTAYTDATLINAPSVAAAPLATDKTLLAGSPPAPASAPTSALPASSHSRAPAAPTLPPHTMPPSQPSSGSRSRIWLIIALVGLLGLGMLGALVGGILLFTRSSSSTTGTPTSVAGGGLARLPTAVARPTAPPKPTAKPTSAPPPTATAQPGGQGAVLIEDDFDDPSSSELTEETNNNATYEFIDGAYAISVKVPKYIVWSSYTGTYDDVDIQVDASLDEGPLDSAAGVLFRYQDEDNFYYYRVSADGSYNLTLYAAGERRVLVDWTEAPEIKGRQQVNHLGVEAVGDHIRLLVNGTLLAEVSDDTFAKGEIALAVTTFEEGDATFKFDNLIIRRG
jgi:hypothetical protein